MGAKGHPLEQLYFLYEKCQLKILEVYDVPLRLQAAQSAPKTRLGRGIHERGDR
jgi:hypothetical protein